MVMIMMTMRMTMVKLISEEYYPDTTGSGINRQTTTMYDNEKNLTRSLFLTSTKKKMWVN